LPAVAGSDPPYIDPLGPCILAGMEILIMPGVTLPEVTPADLLQIESAAGSKAAITIATTRDDELAAAPTVDVILGRIDPELLAAAPKLRWLHAVTSGVDMFLFPEFVRSNIVLTSEKGLVGPHLADHAFALLLALTRQIGVSLRHGRQSWDERIAMRQEAIELSGLTMGIVGMGGTGREVARRAAAFGMEVRAVDRDVVLRSPEVTVVRSMEHFPQLLQQSDVVTICAPLTVETRGLFNDETIAMMKPGAYLINVTRGPIIDDAALIRAMDSGHLAGAGLDVTPEEPLSPEHPFWEMPNIVMTPHTAGASPYRAERNLERFRENLRRFRRDQPLIGVIDKQLGY
jgi:phosphoglycerate dehydrogenase-like enzyme